LQPLVFIAFIGFLFLTTFSVMNVIVGVVVDDIVSGQRDSKETRNTVTAVQRVERLWEVYNTFMAMDTDGDGMLSQQEFSDNPLVVKALLRATTEGGEDEDDKLVATHELFGLMDVNRDGTLSRTEFTRGMIRMMEALNDPSQAVNKVISLGRSTLYSLKAQRLLLDHPGAKEDYVSRIPSSPQKRFPMSPRAGGNFPGSPNNSNPGAGHAAPHSNNGLASQSTTAGPTTDSFISRSVVPAPAGADDEEAARLAWLRQQLELNLRTLNRLGAALGVDVATGRPAPPPPQKQPQAAAVPMSARSNNPMSARGEGLGGFWNNLGARGVA
jgi:hypothetical protein